MDIKLNYIDHVAIRVKDLEASAKWYETVLGLKKCAPKKWRPFPIFMMQEKFGVALFPANLDDTALPKTSRNIKIDHFAFNVSNEDFQKAQDHYEALGLSFHIQDHYYFHSMYTEDPDGHTVELTTLVVNEKDFYSDL